MDGCAAVVTITQVQKYPFLRYINVPRRQCPRHRVRRLFRRRRPFRRLRLPGKAQQQSKHIILCQLRYVVYIITIYEFSFVLCITPLKCFFFLFICICVIFAVLSFSPARYTYHIIIYIRSIYSYMYYITRTTNKNK